ncbi:UPF0236 family transposase-like protein [Priestia endophytica]|uniref:UPF0236 family transposase-like protein n=1 Tax=Priestia endophytica TaxID=135735 RepID=UPI0024137B6F|nr:UPF0236 family protein [Priestia endophytica]
MKGILEEMDEQITKQRDKGRFRLLGKWSTTIDSLFGPIEIARHYYWDRTANRCVFLLDQYAAFDGEKGLTPLLQETAMELAITGPSYRQAARTLETLLGYSVLSHEGIRQQMLGQSSFQKRQS